MDKKLVGWSHQLVVVNGPESQWPSVTSGAPQGSVQYLLFQCNSTGSESTFGQEAQSCSVQEWDAGAGIG